MVRALALSLLPMLVTLWSLPAGADTLVNCSEKRFKSGSSARSLMGWSRRRFEQVKQASTTGVYPKYACDETIRMRGDAHCQRPKDAAIRTALKEALELCARLKSPPRAKGAAPVNCRDPRFSRPRDPVKQLLSWAEMNLRGLASLHAHQPVKPKCDQALSYAGAAYCKAPTTHATRAMVLKVRKRCAEAVKARGAQQAATKAMLAKVMEDQKKARKIVNFPRSTYRGGGAAMLGRRMRAALLGAKVAKAARDIKRMQPMGNWATGRYTDTRLRYRKITGTMLWRDTDNDGVCRFTTYIFISTRTGRGWTPLKFKAFCMGCPEGWTRCK